MKRLRLAVVVVIALVSGCATTSSSGVSVKAATSLKSYVANVRTAASGTSLPAVRKAVRALDAEVTKLVGEGEITSTRGQQIQNQAAAVQSAYLHLSVTPTPSVTPTSPTPTPTVTTPTPTPTVTATVTVTPTETATGTSSATTPSAH